MPRSPALAAGLRKAREAAPGAPGVRKVTTLLGWHHPMLWRFEQGERTPSEQQVRAILDVLAVTGREREDLLALARGRVDAAWLAVTPVEHARQLSATLRLESAATQVTAVAPLLIPELLQTDAYARVVLAGEQLPADDLEIATAVRLGRQTVLTRAHPARLVAILWEPVLHARVGGAVVMRDQLRHLLEVAARPNASVRVIPMHAGWHPALDGPFTLLDTGTMTVVHTGGRGTGVYLHDPVDVARFAGDVDSALRVAWSAQESEHVIHNRIRDLTHEDEGPRT